MGLSPTLDYKFVEMRFVYKETLFKSELHRDLKLSSLLIDCSMNALNEFRARRMKTMNALVLIIINAFESLFI